MRSLEDDEITFRPECGRAVDLLITMCGWRNACVDQREVRTIVKADNADQEEIGR